jgi:hypothetical protein
MQTTTDPQDALALWNADDTQWILTNGTQYVVCAEHEAVHALEATGWQMTSPEELARTLAHV